MKRRVIAFLAALILLLSFVPLDGLTVASAAEELILKLHYHRPDGNYEGWDVWLWESGGAGNGYPFAEENGEMVATMSVTPGTTSIGFIVRTQDWSKDVNEDQFIDIPEMVSGTVHIYVESGVKGYTKQYGDDAVIGTKMSEARYDGEMSILTKFTGTLTEDLGSYFTVNGPDGEVAVKEVKTLSDTEYQLVLAQELDTGKSYTVTCDGTTYKIVMPIVFSTAKFEEKYTYDGDDLGAVYTKERTSFRVWAPTAEEVSVRLYRGGLDGADDLIEQLPMTQDIKGTWVAEKTGDLNGVYYTYLVKVGGAQNEACDPYARTTGVNGKRAMVIDLAATNPEGWVNDADPNAGKSFNDAIIYELHIRDLSADENSGIKNVGKFLGLTETGTKTPSGVSTGLDHIKELGVTHLHLLPIYDFGSVNESSAYTEQFNWGYDPVNYNVPEGSYSTDARNGEVRVRELKQMVKTLHDNGISVIMDVVYNHVQSASDFCFNQIVPMYFTRISENGTYSNGSGCGNDTATERSMVKKYIVDSVAYWADAYHIDGFRFDLVGLMDTELINAIVKEVHKSHPNVVFYGEGWTLSTDVTKEGYSLATQTNSTMTPGFAYFSDTLRDLLKGNVFNNTEAGYVSGARGLEAKLEKCFMGLAPDWCTTPAQSINYASCHDNMTLIDRITNSTPSASREDRIKMNNLAAAIYMTSEGIPFMQAGEEMLRTKVKADGSFDENSYASSDVVNCLKWSDLDKKEYQQVFEYYKGLIAFRKAHAALRLTNADDVKNNVFPVSGMDANVVAFQINGGVNGETADSLFVIFNSNSEKVEVTLPDGKWNVYVEGQKAGTEVLRTIKNGKVTVDGISAMVLAQDDNKAKSDSSPLKVIIPVAGVAAVAGAAGVVLAGKKRKAKGK
ncbi:MAG: type I pullulanase [Lachnospiraceae bacterium]|nr:type I pullulanase [Lachnospiraceae bacterium]